MTPDQMKLRYYPDPVLMKAGEPVTEFDDNLRANVKRMFEIILKGHLRQVEATKSKKHS